MFYGCSLLSSLPDISKWNTKKVINFTFMFYECRALSSLPDISKWNINKDVGDMSDIISKCNSLSSVSSLILKKFNFSNSISDKSSDYIV